MTRAEAITYGESKKARIQEKLRRAGSSYGDYAIYYSEMEFTSVAIAALREQEERRWIPVTDRFPEKSGTYFVVTKTGAVTFARFYPEHDFIDCTGKFIRHEKGKFQSNRNVIYWMPLPEPPKEA